MAIQRDVHASENRREVKQYKIKAVPTVVVNGRYKIRGVPEEKELLEKIREIRGIGNASPIFY